MSHPSLSCLAALVLTVALMPLPANAQSSNSNSTSISDYGRDFFYGQSDEEREKEEEKQNRMQNMWQYSGKYNRKPQADGDKEEKEIRILPDGEQFIYFVRTADTKNNEATLRLISPVSINGCAKVVPPVVTVRRGGGMLAFKIEDGAVGLDKSVRYAHYQCHQGSNVASADITLNRDELLQSGIRTLTFQTGAGAMDTYNVTLNDNTLTLVPKTSFAFKPLAGSAKTDPLSYYFYPDNLVILYAPGAGKKSDLTEQIAGLAQSKGLTPAPGPVSNTNSKGYFIDQQGTLAGSLAFDANAFVGTVTEPEHFQGPGGAYEREKPVDIYAKRPSTLD